MGRWSAGHWKAATFGWLAFVLLAFGLGGMVGTKNIDNAAGPGESGRMDRILEAGFKQPAAEHVLIQSRSVRAGTPAFDAAVADVVEHTRSRGRPRRPLAAHARQRGPHLEGRALGARRFKIRGAKDEAVDKIDPVLDAVAAAQRAHPDFPIGEFGDASAEKGSRRRTRTTSARRGRSR